ncbi:MAG TPA: hypothetical protein ENK55_00205 [Actinobacteria bacterium]|nr:hypothetical protein [Actinomycetota bacterium]
MTAGLEERRLAAKIVRRVLDEGAYSNVLLRRELEGLDPRSRGFSHRLVLTTIRMLLRIDRALAAAADRPIASLDPEVRALLRVAAAELLFLGTPSRAAVHVAVTAAKLERPRAAGFVNAVLRRVAAEGEPPLPRGRAGTALALGFPEWILDRLVAQWGEDEAVAFLEASNTEAPLVVRLRPGAPRIGEPVPGVPDAVGVSRTELDALAADAYVVADAASIAVGHAVGVRAGERLVDLAAAPGGKALHLWDAAGGTAFVVAMDRHARRAASGRRRTRRLGAGVRWVVGDARRPPFRPGTLDRVLLDAPCTGLGTLRRRPEIRHRLEPSAPRRLGRLQREMLEAALELGARRLVYSVCTVFAEETVDVVADLGFEPPEGLPGRTWGDGRLLAPHLGETDGMFVAVFSR